MDFHTAIQLIQSARKYVKEMLTNEGFVAVWHMPVPYTW